MTPYYQHSRVLAVFKSQLALGEVRRKHLWQDIVKSKITNQALCLKYCNKNQEYSAITAIAEKVRSGDSENIEAIAASRYFHFLFGKDFYRRNDCAINSFLNYGYAILRGCAARNLAVYGFNCNIGLHHVNELNSFNLADDIMEPFRPVVDLLVASLFTEELELNADIKKQLFNVLNLDIISGQQRHSVAFAIERLVKSLSTAYSEEAKLLLPTLCELQQHRYE